jgi:NAD(P)-dependent dehydrogenase (short-subunit alcohol dehydrogenase family)
MTTPDPSSGSRPARSLAGKVAIVTGAGALGNGIGNGRASALLLAADGCTVICASFPILQASLSLQPAPVVASHCSYDILYSASRRITVAKQRTPDDDAIITDF